MATSASTATSHQSARRACGAGGRCKNSAAAQAEQAIINPSCDVDAINASDIGADKTANIQTALAPAAAMAAADTTTDAQAGA